jgi:hypothetical protein
MVASQTRLFDGGYMPQWISLLAGWLVGIVAINGWGLGGLEGVELAAAAEAAAPPAAAAAAEPQYAEMPLEEEYKKRPPSVQRSQVTSIIRNSPSKFANDGDKKTVDDYYKTYALPRWTQVEYAAPRAAHGDRDNMTLLAFRRELKKELAMAKGQVHEYLNDMVLEFMGGLLQGNYHPFAQVNAALMIGELDEDQPGKPYLKALPVLIRIVEDAKLRDPVRADAMVGILRHVEAGLGEDAPRAALTAAMLKLLTGEISSPMTAQGQVWIRGQALEVLGRLGSPGENGEIFTAILASLGDAEISALVGPQLSYTTRCIAANALGRLNYTGAKGINATEAPAMLGQLTVQVCDDGLRAAKMRCDPVLVRRALTARLGAVLAALRGADANHKGILPIAEAQQKDSLTELQTFLEDAMEVIEVGKKSMPAEVDAAATKLRDSVTTWLQKQST